MAKNTALSPQEIMAQIKNLNFSDRVDVFETLKTLLENDKKEMAENLNKLQNAGVQ